MEKHTNRSGKDLDSYWDKEEDEIDGLDAAIIKKYGEGSLEKLRKKKAEIEAGFGNQIQVVLGFPHVIVDNLETTSNQEVDSKLKYSNIEVVNGGSSSLSQNTITKEGTCMNLETNSDLILKPNLDRIEQDVDCSNRRSSLEVSSMQKNGDSNVKDGEVTSLVNGKELGFYGGNPNDMVHVRVQFMQTKVEGIL
ncbi:hypothetical protein FRX31_002576 [Thalictrum thalictroides]|uniref:Uncharacterized protein n=1 Tax=Thalictrum thalictroides TaxID=46969 RepID=A0A7J6XFJ5_THATH|nr:hypothetical protein FRX31_002576 [Thalictrum thalictroides]